MFYNALAIILVTSAMAVEDPAANVKKLEKGQSADDFLKKLHKLEEQQIEALGTINSGICALIEYVHVDNAKSKDDEFPDRMRRRLNLGCALDIQKSHPDVFIDIFDESSKGEKMEFVRRMGDAICAHESVFSGSPVSEQVQEYCAKMKSLQLEAVPITTMPDDSSAFVLQASFATACGAALVVLFV